MWRWIRQIGSFTFLARKARDQGDRVMVVRVDQRPVYVENRCRAHLVDPASEQVGTEPVVARDRVAAYRRAPPRLRSHLGQRRRAATARWSCVLLILERPSTPSRLASL